MKNNTKNANALIKEKGLAGQLHHEGIARVNKEALSHLAARLRDQIAHIAEVLAREIAIKGKKTLEIRDIDKALAKMGEKEEYWEI